MRRRGGWGRGEGRERVEEFKGVRVKEMRRQRGCPCWRRWCFRGSDASRRREGKAPPRRLLVDHRSRGRGYAGEVEEDVVLDGAVGLRDAVSLDRRVGHEVCGQSVLASR